MIKALLILLETQRNRESERLDEETEEEETPKESEERLLVVAKKSMRNRFWNKSSGGDDADAAAGISPPSGGKLPRLQSSEDLFEDIEPVLVLGVDISHMSRKYQFLVCASGVFGFSLMYGFLQELISVHICNRQLGLFLAMAQFTGYTMWSFVLRNYVYEKKKQYQLPLKGPPPPPSSASSITSNSATTVATVPLLMYLGLSLLRAIDLGMTNLAMQYVNYPAKTLMKSSRVVFTMMFGALILRKRYRPSEYVVVMLMVSGLAIFMHADANSSAVFNSLGIMMLVSFLLRTRARWSKGMHSRPCVLDCVDCFVDLRRCHFQHE